MQSYILNSCDKINKYLIWLFYSLLCVEWIFANTILIKIVNFNNKENYLLKINSNCCYND